MSRPIASPDDWLGPYRKVRPIGRGGFGSVFQAEDRHGAQVALKVLDALSDNVPSARARFARELVAAQRVTSPYVARVINSDLNGALPWIAYQFISGETLKGAIQIALLSGEQARVAFLSLSQGLAAVHEAGLVHRDVTPDNIMIDGQGKGVLIDLGIAALGESGKYTREQIGKTAYQAPEQWASSAVTPAVDIWQLGICLARALGGRLPFKTGSPLMFTAITDDEPDLAGLPLPYHKVVSRCLAKSPSDRPTAEEVTGLLAEVTIPPPDSEEKALDERLLHAADASHRGHPGVWDAGHARIAGMFDEIESTRDVRWTRRARTSQVGHFYEPLPAMRLIAVEPGLTENSLSLTPVLEPVPPFEPASFKRLLPLDQSDLIRGRVRMGDVVFVKHLTGRWATVLRDPLLNWRSGQELLAELPKECPSCGTGLQYQMRSFSLNGFGWRSRLRCGNSEVCPEQVIRRLGRFVHKRSLGISALRGSGARVLVESGTLMTEGELFGLTERDLLAVPEFSRSAGDLSDLGIQFLDQLARARIAPLERHMCALGITRWLSHESVEELCGEYPTLRAVYDAAREGRISQRVGAADIEQWLDGPDGEWHRRLLDQWRNDGADLGW